MQDELRQAIELAQNNQPEQAREILRQITKSHPEAELAWLWLATVAENRTERVSSLRRVLGISPANERAKAALEKLGESISPASPPTTENEELNVLERILRRKFTTADYAGIFLLVAVGCYVIFVFAGGLGGGDNNNDLDDFVSPPTLSVSFTPFFSPTPFFTPTITNTPRPPQTAAPAITLAATWTPAPSNTPRPTRTLAPTFTPFPSRTPFITDTPIPTRTRRPSATPTVEQPTETPEPIEEVTIEATEEAN